MSREDEVRRQLEQAAAQQQLGQCPVEGDVDAAFGIIKEGKKVLRHVLKGGTEHAGKKTDRRVRAAAKIAKQKTGGVSKFGPLHVTWR